MSRSPIRYSPSTGGFYRIDVHDVMPDDVVSVGRARHAGLLAAQATRRIVPGPDGKPTLTPLRKVTREDQLARAIAAVKREAGRRILAIASLERQANDAAAMAIAALEGATPKAEAARARRAAIDDVRAASNTIETAIAGWSLAALTKYDAAADARWPQEA